MLHHPACVTCCEVASWSSSQIELEHMLLNKWVPCPHCPQVIDMLLGDHTSPAQELPTPAQKALPMRSSGFSSMSQIGWDNCPSTAPSAPGASPPPKELEQFSLINQPIQHAAGQPLPVPTVASKASPAPNGSRSPGLLMPDALLSSWAAVPGLDAPAQPLPLSSLLRSTQSMVQRPAESGLPAELVARRRPPGQGSPLQVGARQLRSAHTLGPLQLDTEVEALCQALGYLLDPEEQAHKPGNRHKARQQQAVQPQLSMPPTQPRPPAVPGSEGAKLRHAKLSNVLETEAEGGLDVELDRSSCQQQGEFGSSSSSLLVSPQLSRADVMRLSTWHESVSILFTDIRGFTDMSQQLHPSSVMLFLNHLYSIFDALLETHDVYKIETIGDR
ncbi:hypothetical protein QJQ45_021029 [Haematococcus lacustris]|nr:hypothetical protein QJQ45_021029 [Haematococcus lacustris]